MAGIDALCRKEASQNHGVISRDRASQMGLSGGQIRYRVAEGLWTEIFPGTYFIGGTLPTWESRLTAAVKWAGPGSAAGFRSAAAHYGWDGCRKGPIEIVTTAALSRAPFRCHRTNHLPKGHVRTKARIRVTRPARTLFDISWVMEQEAFRKAATDALRKRMTSLGELHAVHRELAACGRNGTQAMRAFLESYDPRLTLTANEFEAALFKILMAAGLALPTPQEPVHDSRGRIVRVDFLYLDPRIVIEADGFGFHSDPVAATRDADRRNRLVLEGWLVLVFTWQQVMHQPRLVVDRVSEAILHRS